MSDYLWCVEKLGGWMSLWAFRIAGARSREPSVWEGELTLYGRVERGCAAGVVQGQSVLGLSRR